MTAPLVPEPGMPMFSQLMQVIEDRRQHPSEASYTCQLFAGGIPRIAAKIVEEAGEVVEAAEEPGTDGANHLVAEAADLVYHLMVLLAAREVSIDDVANELARRFGTSGLEEKRSRPSRGEPPA